MLELVLQSKSPDLEKQKILDYIRNLITNEFLFTNLRKVAISHKDLDDLTNILKDINNQRKLTEDLLQIKNSIEQYAKLELGEGISQYTEICKKMSYIFNDKKQHYLKVDLVNCCDSVLPKNLKKKMEDFVNFISKINLAKGYRNRELESFTEKFVEKYGEYVEVPIKELLDGNLGLGLPKQTLGTHVKSSSSVEEQNFLSYLSKEVFKAVKNCKKEIDISNIPLGLLYPNSDRFVANQLELYCEIKNFESQPVISVVPNTGSDMIGKSIGRFASYFPNSYISLDSQLDNVELIEFPRDSKNLNVMSAKHAHSKKLLLSYDDNDNTSIELDSLVVGVIKIDQRYKLYFRDLRTGSIVNFVTTSMLNHKSNGVFSDLARFLLTVSLEWQDNPFSVFRIIENFDFLPYIPKIKYGDIILSEEKWVLSDIDKSDLSSINQWKKDFDVPRLLYFHKADERLLVDLENDLDTQWLLKQNVDKLYFTRFEKYDGKNCEFIFGFENYQSSINHYSMQEKSVRRLTNNFYKNYVKTFSSDWIYFRLYGINSSILLELRERLLLFTDELLVEKLISDFHFVNYRDKDKGSLRLRFKINNDNNFEDLRFRITHWIDFLLESGFCNDVSFNLYEREIERYGGDSFTTVCERMFSIDSFLTLKLFSKKLLNDKDLLSVLHSTFLYVRLLGIPLKRLLELLKGNLTQNRYRKSFKKLFPNNTIVVKEFKEYFDYKNQFEIFNEVFREFPPIDGYFEGKNDIVYSLLHMHMNRVGIFPYREKEYLYFIMYIAEPLNNYKEFT